MGSLQDEKTLAKIGSLYGSKKYSKKWGSQSLAFFRGFFKPYLIASYFLRNFLQIFAL